MEACKYCGQQHAYFCPMISAIEYDRDGLTPLKVWFRDAMEYERLKATLDHQSDAKKQLKSAVERVLANS